MKGRTYSKKFKLDALNLVKTKGFPATAKELKISETALRNWAKKYNFSRQASQSEMIEAAKAMERKRELEKEQQKLKATAEFLKDAIAFFSRETQK